MRGKSAHGWGNVRATSASGSGTYVLSTSSLPSVCPPPKKARRAGSWAPWGAIGGPALQRPRTLSHSPNVLRREWEDVLGCPPQQIADQITTRGGPSTIWVLHGDTTRQNERGKVYASAPLPPKARMLQTKSVPAFATRIPVLTPIPLVIVFIVIIVITM